MYEPVTTTSSTCLSSSAYIVAVDKGKRKRNKYNFLIMISPYLVINNQTESVKKLECPYSKPVYPIHNLLDYRWLLRSRYHYRYVCLGIFIILRLKKTQQKLGFSSKGRNYMRNFKPMENILPLGS